MKAAHLARGGLGWKPGFWVVQEGGTLVVTLLGVLDLRFRLLYNTDALRLL